MKYRLKPSEPDITCVDGPMALRSYRAGEVYTEIPPECEGRFEPVEESEEGGEQR